MPGCKFAKISIYEEYQKILLENINHGENLDFQSCENKFLRKLIQLRYPKEKVFLSVFYYYLLYDALSFFPFIETMQEHDKKSMNRTLNFQRQRAEMLRAMHKINEEASKGTSRVTLLFCFFTEFCFADTKVDFFSFILFLLIMV